MGNPHACLGATVPSFSAHMLITHEIMCSRGCTMQYWGMALILPLHLNSPPPLPPFPSSTRDPVLCHRHNDVLTKGIQVPFGAYPLGHIQILAWIVEKEHYRIFYPTNHCTWALCLATKYQQPWALFITRVWWLIGLGWGGGHWCQ